MPDIRHHVGIKAPVAEVYDALATRQGLAGWWTREVEGDSAPGGKLAFGFGGPEPAAVMRVDELTSPERVGWTCVEGPDDWRDTRITFELSVDDGETGVLFTHGGWRDSEGFMAHCSTKWAYFLLGLKDGLEGGRATPWPTDKQISIMG